MYSLGRDISSEVTTRFALVSTALTAAGSGDNTEVDGATIDLMTIPADPSAVLFAVPFRAFLGVGQTGIVTANLQDSADGTNWTDITTPAVKLTLVGGTGGTTEVGMVELGYDLTKCRRYIRIQVTPDLNRAGTDTGVIGAGQAIFGGFNEVPQ